jgi:hypothetical protein
LNRIRSLAPQLVTEATDVSVQDVLHRLQAKRTSLSNRLVDLQEQKRRTFVTHQQHGSRPHFIGSAIDVKQPRPFGEAEQLQMSVLDRFRQQQGTDYNLPPGFTGYVDSTVLQDRGLVWQFLNHGSRVCYHFDPTQFQTAGYLKINVSLHDNASFWRYDEPDGCEVGQVINWILPTVTYDSVVYCSLIVDVHADVTIAADDGGTADLGIMAGNTDPNGVWPILYEDTFAWYQFNDSGSITTTAVFPLTFEAKANAAPGVALICCTTLAAQDGTASADVAYLVSSVLLNGGSRWSSPKLFYSRWPI